MFGGGLLGVCSTAVISDITAATNDECPEKRHQINEIVANFGRGSELNDYRGRAAVSHLGRVRRRRV